MHIGAPKTGTSYVQDRLALNTKRLAEHDVHYLSRSPIIDPTLFQFRVALDLLGQDWGGTPGHAEGAWDAFVAARPAPDRLGDPQPRDPRAGAAGVRRQAQARPARRRDPRRLRRPRPRPPGAGRLAGEHQAGPQVVLPQVPRAHAGRRASWFSRAFDLPSVLNVWGAGLPPEQVHVVTVPRRGVPGAARRAAVAPVLRGVRHRPGVGAARQRARQPRRSAWPRPSCCGGSTAASSGPRGGRVAYDDLIRDLLDGGPARRPRVGPGAAAAGAVRAGPTSRPSAGSSGSSRAASTSSATSPSCGRCRRPRATELGRPRPGLAEEAARRRGRRAGRDDPGGRPPARPGPGPRQQGAGRARAGSRGS